VYTFLVGFLQGKVVAVTGGASGFGREIATQAARRGAAVAVLDVDEAGAGETAALVTADGGRAFGLGLDVRDRAAFARVVDDVVARTGRLDTLVNNAGVMPLAFLADHARAADAWDRCVDVNLKGTLHGIYAVYDQMLGQGGGHIVNISSVYGNAGVAGAAVYSATKAAIATLSNALRVETQGRIRVTLVRPSGMAGTRLSAGILDFTAPAALAGHRVGVWQEHVAQVSSGALPPELTDREDAACWTLRPADVAAQVVHAMDAPLGLAVTEITLRATGEDYVF
jgi:NADP-dependent 3-hydroxy acid dehydrogenase YdfG